MKQTQAIKYTIYQNANQPNASPLISVIIPTWNRKSYLIQALKSIYSQNYKNFEVIVIDNGSNDGTADLVEEQFPDVKLIKNNKNLGASFAKNQGILKSKGTYTLFCDSDIEFTHKECIKKMVQILEENKNIGAIGGEAYKLPNNKVETKKKMITPYKIVGI